MALKVLIVEDDAPTLELMGEVLASLKAEVRAVSDSEAASALVNQERFDGIFLDLQMPKVDGFELTRRIRKSSWNKSAPIVVVTGEDDVKTMEKAFALPAARCLKIAATLYGFHSRQPLPAALKTKLSREQVPISAREEFFSKWAVLYP
ncbi:MAG: hypothetical protein DMG86_23285 [Acidobacteria bacterium]|nr:MAG: hypothetical protein DMG86_23285 [Acidobacteriota bacterium]